MVFWIRRAESDVGITCVILCALKTSISYPDDLFRLAEAAARKLKMSRSQLYSRALAEYLERRKTSKVTQRLNEIYSAEPSKLDSALISAQIESLVRESW
jgi:metal-responsive CopG/Arc/MetJ family transcriptional regulator